MLTFIMSDFRQKTEIRTDFYAELENINILHRDEDDEEDDVRDKEQQ